MDVGDAKIFIDNDLLEKFDVEGVVLNPSNYQSGFLVMSSKDDTFTLHLYELQLNQELEYEIVKEIAVKTFFAYLEMEEFLNSLTSFKEDDFTEFFKQYGKDVDKDN